MHCLGSVDERRVGRSLLGDPKLLGTTSIDGGRGMHDIIVMASLVACGVLCGWWLRGGLAQEGPPSDAPSSSRIDRALEHLRSIASGVADDLGEHHTRIAEIHNRLQEAARAGPEHLLRVVGELIECNEEMQRQLQSAETRLQYQAREIASRSEEAHTDPLTKLANRRAFDVALEEGWEQHQRSETPLSLLMLDVDHFKRFNDRFGHPAGDAVLKGVAQVLQQELGNDGLVCRYGGEEFAVVFPGRTAREVARAVERCRESIAAQTISFEGAQFRITCSTGLAELKGEEDTDEMVSRADEALYQSKKAGRNCSHWHDGRRVRPVADAWTKRAIHTPEGWEEKLDLEKTDFSAGISTQAVFMADVSRRLAERHRNGTSLAVLLAKIDGYDTIVAQHGDSAGRAVTRAATLLFKATMRDMDHVAEFSEGTLSLLLPGCRLDGAVTVAERLREGANRCRLPQKRFPPERFTLTIAVAEAEEGEDASDLVARIEDAVASTSAHGSNCTCALEGKETRLIGIGDISLAAGDNA